MVAPQRSPDAPRPLVLVAIALVCLLGGFGLARASLDVDRAAEATSRGAAATTGPAGETTTQPPADAVDAEPATGSPDAGSPAATPEAIDAGTPDPAAEALQAEPPPAASADAPEPAAPPPSRGGAPRILPGRIAYIRCDGLPEAATGACPRDLSVERRVLDALRGLSSCPALAGRTGLADVRVVFDTGRMSGLGFRDFGARGADRDAIRGCLEPRLSPLRSELGASRMTVTFQFELAP